MIRIERPPNYNAIVKVFPLAAKGGVIYAYGEDIFNPDGIQIPTALLKHEYRHCARQFAERGKAEGWWANYLASPEYRYAEELVAHLDEYHSRAAGTKDRNARAQILQATAARLVAPLYGYGPERTLSTALRDLRWLIEKR